MLIFQGGSIAQSAYWGKVMGEPEVKSPPSLTKKKQKTLGLLFTFGGLKG